MPRLNGLLETFTEGNGAFAAVGTLGMFLFVSRKIRGYRVRKISGHKSRKIHGVFCIHIAANICLRPSDSSVINFLYPLLSCNLFKRSFSASAHNSSLPDFNINNFTICFYVLFFTLFIKNPTYAFLKRYNSIVAIFSKRYNCFVFVVYAALFFANSCT